MDMNNSIVISVILGFVIVAISVVLFTIRQAMKSGVQRYKGIQTIKKQPRCLKIFKTRF